MIYLLILEKTINVIFTKKENSNNIFYKKEYLLTQNELKFYKLLKSITDKYNLIIFTQVSLYQIIKANNFKE